MGIVSITAAILAMLTLAFEKSRLGALGSATVLADAPSSCIDPSLADAMMVGPLLNALLGWMASGPLTLLLAGGA